MASTGKVYFLSRPRRFGKSLLVSTLEAYYRDDKELFKGLAMESLEKDWYQYPIFHIDFSNGNFTEAGALETRIELQMRDWEAIYGKKEDTTDLGYRFTEVLRRASEQTGRRAVVLIDEYDKPILDVLDTDYKTTNQRGEVLSLEEWNRNILKSLYSTFKAADRYLQFVLLTGVTKFSQVSVFSGFNQPDDISMSSRYEALSGITQEELEHYFEEPIADLAATEECTIPEMKEQLKRQYDGYHFSERMTDIYNPFSILNAFNSNKIRDYWFVTGTPTYLVRLLQHGNEQMNELTGKYYDVSMFINHKADVEQPLPMIYQSGYLTVKDYNKQTDMYLLDFPNNEVRKGFLTVIATSYLKPRQGNISSWMANAFLQLTQGNTAGFRDELTAFLASIPYNSHAPAREGEASEKHFQYTFYLIIRLIGVYCLRVDQEKIQSEGRVDCILELKDYIYIFEFKHNGSADEALQQIEEKGYTKPYLTVPRKLFRVGVNFSSKTGTIEEWKEA